jgi:hypothetical protein
MVLRMGGAVQGSNPTEQSGQCSNWWCISQVIVAAVHAAASFEVGLPKFCH